MSSRMKRTTTSAALVLALLLPGLARADDAAGHYNLALQHKREGKLTEAVAECQKAIPLRPNYAAAHMTLGSLYRTQKNYPGAVAEYEKVVKLEPKDALGHYNLGVAYAGARAVGRRRFASWKTRSISSPTTTKRACRWARSTARRPTTSTPSIT